MTSTNSTSKPRVQYGTRIATVSDGDAVRNIFPLSHISLAPSSARIIFRNFFFSPISISVLSLFIAFLYSQFHIHFLTSLFVLAIILSLIYLLMFMKLQSIWGNMCQPAIKTRDLSPELFGRACSSATGCCMVVTTTAKSGDQGQDQNREIVIGHGCLYSRESAIEFGAPFFKDHFESPTSTAGLITRLGILPEYQGRGAGRALVNAILAEAKKRGLTEIWLVTTSVQPVAIGMYEGYGFKFQYDFSKGSPFPEPWWHKLYRPFYAVVYRKIFDETKNTSATNKNE